MSGRLAGSARQARECRPSPAAASGRLLSLTAASGRYKLIAMAAGGVCLIGNFCVDLILRGVPRLPEWGQEVAGDDYLLVSSGQTTYTAFALRRPGGAGGGDRLRRRGRLGRADPRATWRPRGWTPPGWRPCPAGRTALTVAAVRPDGERAFLSDFACLAHADETVIDAALGHGGGRRAGRACWACSAGRACPWRAPRRCSRRARRSGKTTMLDTGWDPEGWQPPTLAALQGLLAQIAIFLPNLDEARAITGAAGPAEAARAPGRPGPRAGRGQAGAGRQPRPRGRAGSAPAGAAGRRGGHGRGRRRVQRRLPARPPAGPAPGGLPGAGSAAAALYIARPRDRFPSAAQVERC